MKWKLIFVILYFVSEILYLEACPCPNQKECDPPSRDIGIHKEVFVFSNGSTNVQFWSWETITTLIVPSSFSITNEEQANTLCIAHRKGRKFGITVDLSLSRQINDTTAEAEEWVQSVLSQQQAWHADIITVNLLPYFSSDTASSEQNHVSLVKILSRMKENAIALSDVVKVACVIPWKPPCAEKEPFCDFTSLSNDVCDYFVINPDSFTDLGRAKCRATANIPLSKLLYVKEPECLQEQTLFGKDFEYVPPSVLDFPYEPILTVGSTIAAFIFGNFLWWFFIVRNPKQKEAERLVRRAKKPPKVKTAKLARYRKALADYTKDPKKAQRSMSVKSRSYSVDDGKAVDDDDDDDEQ